MIQITNIVETNWERLKFLEKDAFTVRQMLSGAVETAKKLCQVNYRIAIPHVYNGKVQFLLPLFFQDGAAERALTLEKVENYPPDGKFCYEASTIFTMSMVYCNSRTLARPERDWLMPQSYKNKSMTKMN